MNLKTSFILSFTCVIAPAVVCVAAADSLRAEEEYRKTAAQPCKESFSPGMWSPRTQLPSARLSPPPARRDHHRGPTVDEPYQTTSLVARSRTPSPSRSNVRSPVPQYYGTANLTDRSRSPSPENSREGGALPPPAVPVRRPEHPGGERRRRRRRRRSDAASAGRMPRVLPSPTVTPHHSPDRFNFPRLFTSPSASPPCSPVARRQSFHLPGEDRDHADRGLTSRWRSQSDARRRHTHHFETETTGIDQRTPATRGLHRQHSESTAMPSGTASGGIRTSNTWNEHRYRLYDSVKHSSANDYHENDSDSDSDGEGWC